jgi:hypothetical protein
MDGKFHIKTRNLRQNIHFFFSIVLPFDKNFLEEND